MGLEDKALRVTVQREISRFANSVDDTLMTMACINNVVYLGGRIRPLKGGAGRGVDVRRQVMLLKETIESIRGVTQCVVDAAIEDKV